MNLIRLLCTGIAACCATVGWTALTLPHVFGDGMVLQRDRQVPVWGETAPGERITIDFADQHVRATADQEGHWKAHLKPMPASAEPRALTITGPKGESRVLTNVLVGDVWLCSGQSNMFMPMGPIDWAPDGIENSKAEIAKASDSLLRLYVDPLSTQKQEHAWEACVPATAGRFSAVAYYFGRKLRREIDVPIGLLHISRGGSPIQQWLTPEAAQVLPWVGEQEAVFKQNQPAIQANNTARKAYNNAVKSKDPNAAAKRPEELPPVLFTAQAYYGQTLFHSLIVPVLPYGIRGVIWYQGESNTHSQAEAVVYADMLRGLMRGWRERWHDSTLPFYYVQLPGRESSESEFWPWIRASMLEVSRTEPHTDMVVAMDVGDRFDIHPHRKQPVGERLALCALRQTYGRKVISTGPRISRIRDEGQVVRVEFATSPSPVEFKGGAWNNVELAGSDGVFRPATVMLLKSAAELYHPEISRPVAVRYGWKDNFTPTLFNAAGLPGSPFCYARNGAGEWQLVTRP